MDPFQHEHLLGHVRANYLRDQQLRKVGNRPSDELRVVRLFRQVELFVQVHFELVGEGLELKQLRRLGMLVQKTNGRPHYVEIEIDLLDHTRAPHLDDDFEPVAQQRRMHLSDRSARERLSVDSGEHIAAELVIDRAAKLLEWHRRRVVDELRELVDVLVGKQVRPRGQQLAELEVRGPELLEALAELLRGFTGRRAVADDADLA